MIEIRLETMPSVIFRGLVIMLPLVQHFPEERLIHLTLRDGPWRLRHHHMGTSSSRLTSFGETAP
jgi:hypothetical protein